MADDGGGGPFYGDLRVATERRKGACLFWVSWLALLHQKRAMLLTLCSPPIPVSEQVVPDVAPGFHVPAFYENFVHERREHVQFKVEKREQSMQNQLRPPPPPGMHMNK